MIRQILHGAFVTVMALWCTSVYADDKPASRPAEAAPVTPGATVTAFLQELKDGDIDSAFSMMAPSKRDDIRNEVEKMSDTIRKGKANIKIGKVKVIDDAAAVVVREREGGRPLPIWVARIGQDWRVLLEHPEDFEVTGEQLQRFEELKQWFKRDGDA